MLLDTHPPTLPAPSPGDDEPRSEMLRTLGFSASGEPPASLAAFGDRVAAGVRAATASAVELLRGGPAPVFGGAAGVVFFRAAGSAGGGADAAAWQPYCAGPVTAHDIDCAHDGLLAPGPLARVASLIGPRLSDEGPDEGPDVGPDLGPDLGDGMSPSF